MVPDNRATSGFPWRRLMALGLGVLKLHPASFWSMTPRELGAALEGAGVLPRGADALDRATLDRLIQRYPDQGADHGRGD
nr:rcc01693 family protein [Rhodoligotrophos defluvii]